MRYLTTFSLSTLPEITTDTLIIGMGIAGLRAALEAGRYGKVLIITKSSLRESNTEYAQGGVAVVLSDEDSCEKHRIDTIRTGCGLCDDEAVKILVEEGIERIRELIIWGVNFDKKKGKLLFTQEGGHRIRRILHAKGDAIGREILRVLISKAQEHSNITLMKNTFAIDILINRDGICFGAIIHTGYKTEKVIFAKHVILATGGIGQIYRETTNSKVANGDGIAMAYRCGAKLIDMEFVQFHPTTLYIAGASRALISEAVRGEGGILRNKKGERFMFKYHHDGELAPRDVVSKGIWTELKETRAEYVYLDITSLDYRYVKRRFPNIVRLCSQFGIDVSKHWIPVRPTAHYMIGGIKTDKYGRTNIPGLYACGEVACLGVHGANRLASNSLLEGLVFGYRTGAHLERYKDKIEKEMIVNIREDNVHKKLDIGDIRNSLISLMWRNVGIERDEEGLQQVKSHINFWASYVMNKEFFTTSGWELQNMFITAGLIQKAAITRKESRGVHYRKDYPFQDDIHWKKHIELSIADNVVGF
jgi:L-aspartate oxidase